MERNVTEDALETVEEIEAAIVAGDVIEIDDADGDDDDDDEDDDED